MPEHFCQIVDVFAINDARFVTLWDMNLRRRWATQYDVAPGLILDIGDILRCRYHGDQPDRHAFYVSPGEVPDEFEPPFPLNADKRVGDDTSVVLHPSRSPFETRHGDRVMIEDAPGATRPTSKISTIG